MAEPVREILVATRSAGKLRELVPLLAEFGYRGISLDDAGIPERPEENDIECFTTFEENACAKAEYFAKRSGGRPVLADDSGLCVDALDGAPGVYSKRWSGSTATAEELDDANNARLLEALAPYHGLQRGAAYVCVAAIAPSHAPDAPPSPTPADQDALRREVARSPSCLWARGETRGWIALVPLGSNGFGYDPYFSSEELGKTFGRATTEEKARVSHRARAVRAACAAWAEQERRKSRADS
jgi:XTP/dITP diphosphohydrolase